MVGVCTTGASAAETSCSDICPCLLWPGVASETCTSCAEGIGVAGVSSAGAGDEATSWTAASKACPKGSGGSETLGVCLPGVEGAAGLENGLGGVDIPGVAAEILAPSLLLGGLPDELVEALVAGLTEVLADAEAISASRAASK